MLLVRVLLAGNVNTWLKYLNVAYPGRKPADWNTWLLALQANLSENGRMKAAQKMARSHPSDAGVQLANVRCPALVLMGGNDPDWPDREAEAKAIVSLLTAGSGSYTIIENAGHYPHAQYPQEVAAALLPFFAAPVMPRAGLNTSQVVTSGAELADEAGIEAVSFAALAERLGVKPPALYKHVDSIGNLQHRLATLAMTEFVLRCGRATRQVRCEGDRALFAAVQSYIDEHAGRYSATIGARFQGPDDPLLAAATRVIDSLRAVLSSYGIPPGERDHAIRILRCTMHGYAVLKASNAFQWSNDPDESVAWMIRYIDAGLTKVGLPER